MGICFIVAAVIALDPASESFSELLLMRISIATLMTFVLLIVLWHAIFVGLRVYEPTDIGSALTRADGALRQIVKATLVGTLMILVAGFVFRIKVINTDFLAIFWISVTASTLLGRYLHHLSALRLYGSDGNQRQLLIVGVNERSIRLAMQIGANRHIGYKVAGFVDKTSRHSPGFHTTNHRLVADIDDLPRYLRSTAVDEVVICLPVRSRYDDIKGISRICEEQGITVSMLPDLIPCNPVLSSLRQIGDQAIMTIRPHSIMGFQATLKRMLDVMVSVVLLLALLPLMLVVTLLIKLESPGPVFFHQERLGLNKKRFTMLKFRSMVINAEQLMHDLESMNEAEGPVFKIANDPRVTRIGRFLRKSSLDELPQLINVLRGEMSLVGPRPLTVRDYEGFSEDWHRRRFSIRPGITGLWQVSGRCDIPFEQWMRLDMQYIDQWSLWLDIKLIWQTVPAVLSGVGAK